MNFKRERIFDIVLIVLIIFSIILTYYSYITLFFTLGLALIVTLVRDSYFFKSVTIAITLTFLLLLTFEAVLFPSYYVPPSAMELFSILRGLNYFVTSAFIITIIFVGILITVGVGLGVNQKRYLNQWIVICFLLLLFATLDALYFPFTISDPNTALLIFTFHATIYFICFAISFFIIYITARLITRALKRLYYMKPKFIAEIK